MIRHKMLVVFLLVVSFAKTSVFSAPVEDVDAQVSLSSFEARLSLGFNYDLLRPPTDVDFDYPLGYIGFNMPFNQRFSLRDLGGPMVDTLFSDSSIFRNGDDFRPTGVARQSPNYTIRVDMPMLGGLCSYAYTQNFFLNYETVMGNPSLFLAPDSLSSDMDFLLRGTINMPLKLTMGWETMTFGYAYELGRDIVFALNLHRHLFTMDFRGRADADMVGFFDLQLSGGEMAGDVPVFVELDYPSEMLNGYALGDYEAEVWSPSIGIRLWRFSLASRFGVKTNARGSFYARYKLPAIIDPETGKPKYDLTDQDVLMKPEVRELLLSNAVDSIVYSTDDPLRWELPHGHTLTADIIPERLVVSYTKIFGDIEMGMDKIRKEQRPVESGTEREGLLDSLKMDVGVSVDHIAMLHANYLGAFVNMGVFAMDFRSGDQDHILGDRTLPDLRLGRAALFPVLSLGSTIGTKVKLHLELDVMPLPAFRTGFFYYF
ncbi:MAG: hypothetical protein ACLFQB_03035 [Chitinispirillaceae bacterium]